MAKESNKNKKVKEKVLKDLAKELKSQDKELGDDYESDEESELEEKTESWENSLKTKLQNLELNQFIENFNLENKTAPVLERIASGEAGPVFIPRRVIPSADTPSAISENNGEATYIPSNNETNEPKYSGSSEQIYKTPERFEIEQAGRKSSNESNMPSQQAFFTPSRESDFGSTSQEKIWRVERFETENAGRQTPLEVEKEKYKKYDPKEFSAR